MHFLFLSRFVTRIGYGMVWRVFFFYLDWKRHACIASTGPVSRNRELGEFIACLLACLLLGSDMYLIYTKSYPIILSTSLFIRTAGECLPFSARIIVTYTPSIFITAHPYRP